MPVALSAAVLYADFKRLAEQFHVLDAAQLDRYHFDVMDGHFVSGFGLSPLVIASLRDLTTVPFEAHLLVEQPEHFIESVALAGVSTIIVHAEATLQLRRVISQIRRLGCKVGVALTPTTPPDSLGYILPDVDSILLLAADAISDQAFAEATFEKISEVRMMAAEQQPNLEIAVEGGLTLDTIPACVRAGANALVLGVNGLFRAASVGAADDPAELAQTLQAIRYAADNAGSP